MKHRFEGFWFGFLTTVAGSAFFSFVGWLIRNKKPGNYLLLLLLPAVYVTWWFFIRRTSVLGEIQFDYLPQKPMDNGWILDFDPNVPPEEQREPRFLSAIGDSAQRISMEIQGTKGYYLDYTIVSHIYLANVVEFSIKSTSDSKFYLFMEMSSHDKKVSKTGFIVYTIAAAENLPSPKKIENQSGWIYYVQGKNLGNGWRKLTLHLQKEVEQTFGTEGLEYQSLKKVRLRGSLSLSPITFYKIE